MENDQLNYLITIMDPNSMKSDNLQDEIDKGDKITTVEICRLCGKKSSNYVPIFNENSLIVEKINKCLPIAVNSEDGLPSNICKRCFHYLNISYKLITYSVKTDSIFRQKLLDKKGISNKEQDQVDATTLTFKSKNNNNFTETTEAYNSPMIYEMCNTLFLDTKSFDNHMEVTPSNKFCCDSCDATFIESSDFLNHKLSKHSDNATICNPVQKDEKREQNNLMIPQFIPSTSINLVPIMQSPIEKPKNTQPKSVPNIIRSRGISTPKYIIPTNKNPIKLIPATSLSFPNNPSFLSVTKGTNAGESQMKLVSISPKMLSSINATTPSSIKLLPANISRTSATSTIQILPTTTQKPVVTSTVQILPNNALKNSAVSPKIKILPSNIISTSTSSGIKIITNPLMTFTSNSVPCTSITTTSTSGTLKVLPAGISTATSTLKIIPTNVSAGNHIAIPVNAKVAIPRITSTNKESKPKTRRGPRIKKDVVETPPPIPKVDDTDHNYTNNENDNYDSDDSCNLPLQNAPTVHTSTCAYDVQCDVCGIGVDDDELLIAHKKIHLPQKMGCKECHQECDSLYDLYMHKKKNHNVYKRVALKFSCEQCGKFFTNSWQWENHEEHKCKKKFPMYPCKYCEMGFSTNLKLKRHLRKHKKEMLEDPDVRIYKCVACPKVFVDEEFYEKHRNVHDPECWDKFKCNLCNRPFRDNIRLKEHQQSIHEGIKPHQCDVCGQTFHRRSNMKVHREKHLARKCEHCDESFSKLNALIAHIKDIHKMEPSGKILARRQYKSGCYVCRFCGKKLSTHQSVLDHERIHTGEKPHECKTCGKTFRTYTARWAHVQRHKKGSFTCEHCGKVFSYKQNLLTHILIHMPVEERKHQCSICGKKFLRKGHLNIHMRIHNGERPYTCDICNFSFTQMGDMRRHRARHFSNYTKTRKNQTKVINELPVEDMQVVIDVQEAEEADQFQAQHMQNIEEVQDINEIHNIEVIEEYGGDMDGKTITVIQNSDNIHETGEIQESKVEEITNDLEYQINLMMNEGEPVEEVVVP